MRPRGFTLVELLVALSVMALLAILGWRGLDGMVRTRQFTQSQADATLTLQAGLSQWRTDLDAMVVLPHIQPLDWDGQAMRITRRGAAAVASASAPVVVVAWARRDGQWLRWQSAPVASRADWQDAWQRAALWSRNPGVQDLGAQTALLPLAYWQVFYFRGETWTNPLSSDDSAAASRAVARNAAQQQATQQSTGSTDTQLQTATLNAALPDGVRLVLQLPEGSAFAGTLVQDWARPTVGGGKL
ncbi:PulJ/GspJ family protein [Xylophilus sp.]|uniref:PulJ/GspJ family protein n=1 Tax=Xylophilus sp. TaxID=2653893 RepID=UPI0013B88266|nr:prepilin-type N-terminal cleavage/methylation domain-containing protein [Xylophilus sp.]KAF1049815.1 MAG: hypothetical protein GAK38_00478 [Xylophilus sp.]